MTARNCRRATVFICVAMLVTATSYLAGLAAAKSRLTHQAPAIQNTNPALHQLPEGPREWIPVIADVRIVDTAGTVRERFFRNRDGSTRIEAYSPFVAEQVVTIHNLPQMTIFFQAADGSWSALPIRPAMRLVPLRRPRVGRNATISSAPETWEGVKVYKVSEKVLLAPELNYLEVRDARGPRVREFYNIQVVDPPEDLFVPAPGAIVRKASDAKDLYQLGKKQP